MRNLNGEDSSTEHVYYTDRVFTNVPLGFAGMGLQ